MIKYFILVLFLYLLSGCADFKKGLGFEKDVPDEFLIKKIDPIEKPPNYDLLPPDSKSNENKVKRSNQTKDVKGIIDGSLNTKSTSRNLNQNTTTQSSTEKMILDQLGKND